MNFDHLVLWLCGATVTYLAIHVVVAVLRGTLI